MKLLTLILPCHNETRRLKNNLINLKNLCNIKYLSIIVVDDGSTDSSVSILQSLDEFNNGSLKIVKLHQRAGKAEAVRLGLALASQTPCMYIGFYDIDFALSNTEFLEILNYLRTNEINMLLGNRPLKNRSRSRLIQSAMVRFFISLLLVRSAKDPQCGLKIFRNKNNIKYLFEDKFVCKILFDFELIKRGKEFFCGKKIYNYNLLTWKDVPQSTLRHHLFLFIIYDLLQIFLFPIKKLFHSMRQPLKDTI